MSASDKFASFPPQIEFDTPANRIIAQQAPKNQFRIDTSLADLAFLRQLAVQGRMRYFQGFENATTHDPIEITPTIGETLFIAGGSWSGGSGSSITIIVRNDGNIRDIKFILGGQGNMAGSWEFGVDSLVGDGIKQYTVTSSLVNSSKFTLWGWSENTARIRDVAV